MNKKNVAIVLEIIPIVSIVFVVLSSFMKVEPYAC